MCWPAKATRPCAASKADPDGRPGQRLGGSGLAGGRLSAAAPDRPSARTKTGTRASRPFGAMHRACGAARADVLQSSIPRRAGAHIPISAHEAYGQRATASRHHPVRHGTHHHGRRAAAHRDVQLRGGARFSAGGPRHRRQSRHPDPGALSRHPRPARRPLPRNGRVRAENGLGSPLWACAPTGKNFPWKRRSRRRTARRACSSPSSCATSLNASGFPRRCWPRATS